MLLVAAQPVVVSLLVAAQPVVDALAACAIKRDEALLVDVPAHDPRCCQSRVPEPERKGRCFLKAEGAGYCGTQSARNYCPVACGCCSLCSARHSEKVIAEYRYLWRCTVANRIARQSRNEMSRRERLTARLTQSEHGAQRLKQYLLARDVQQQLVAFAKQRWAIAARQAASLAACALRDPRCATAQQQQAPQQAKQTPTQQARLWSSPRRGMPVVVSFAIRTTNVGLAINWAAAAYAAGLRTHALICLDHPTLSVLRSISGVTRPRHSLEPFVFKRALLPKNMSISHWDNSGGFRSVIWSLRWQVISSLLRAGLTVVHSDLDAIWLRDPLPTLFTASHGEADVMASTGQSAEDWLLCMGWILIRPSTAVLNWLLPTFHTIFHAAGAAAEIASLSTSDDQMAFNRAIKHMKLSWASDPYECTVPAYTDLVSCFPHRRVNGAQSPLPTGHEEPQEVAAAAATNKCRGFITGTAVHDVHGTLSVALIPQRMIRRHGCMSEHRQCYVSAHPILRNDPNLRPLPGQSQPDALARPAVAGDEYVVHCRDLDRGQKQLHQEKGGAFKRQTLDALGLARWGEQAVVRRLETMVAPARCSCNCPCDTSHHDYVACGESQGDAPRQPALVALQILLGRRCKAQCVQASQTTSNKARRPATMRDAGVKGVRGINICMGPHAGRCWRYLNPHLSINSSNMPYWMRRAILLQHAIQHRMDRRERDHGRNRAG